MYKNKTILAVITARGGSKRLPNKNILDLNGKPLIAWTIQEAQKSKYIDKLIVSTDSKEIAKISKSYGVDIPFIRPRELANDKANSFSVLKHSIESIKQDYEYLMLLQPTSPLRSRVHIDESIENLDAENKAIISVSEVDHSPLWCNKLPKDLSMSGFIQKEIRNKRSQDLPKYYRINGAIYVSEIKYFIKNKGFLGEKTKAYIMPKDKSVDIDDKLDFLLVKNLLDEK